MVDRIIQFLESKGENISSFSTRCGLANGALNKAQKKKGGLSAESIKRILLANPDLSADWLFDRPSEGKLFLIEPEEKYLRPNSMPKEGDDWAIQVRKEVQELKHRIQELEWRVKDR